MRDGPTQSFRTISRLFDTLELLARHPRGLSLSEVVGKLDNVPKSSIHYLLKEMSSHGYLTFDERQRVYRMGSGMIRLSATIMYENTLQPVARPIIEELSETTGEDVYLGILHEDYVIYIDKVEGTESIRLNIAVGVSQRHLHSSSVGKLFLAYMMQDEVRRLVAKNGLPSQAGNTITDEDTLFSELERIRGEGLAISNGESIDGIFGIAGPIEGHDGRLLAGICISLPVLRAQARLEFLKDSVRKAALAVSQTM